MSSKLALLHSIVAATHSAGFLKLEASDDAKALLNEQMIEIRTDAPDLDKSKNEAIARATPAGIQFAEANPVQVDNGASAGAWGGSTTETTQPTNFGEQHALNQTTVQTASQPTNTASQGAAFIPVSGVGFTPAAPAKREGVKRDAPEKYPFGELKAPVKTGVDAQGKDIIDYRGSVVFVPSTKDKAGKTRTGEEMAFSLMSARNAAARRYGKELPARVGSDGKSRKQYEYDRTFKTQAGVENGVVGAYIYREYKEQASA